ncbi:(3S)-malyl-CoA thioesterase [Achromobacter veterisilvae]|uniref:(3S)-malyl-CoA thioesterase n=1 Tax=Achromobacter veterisilvae TaxID=2069367 RepID=A0A446CCI4_9BURK|nr:MULTISPECIES: CoA ester lyase [Achromobacter]MCW0210337.1 CoA ester lyase [Achromobacter sp.]SSW65542.1 (3S)-malyl-CoA thioesterase [Achromobacter veterisilvae]
MTRSLLFVPGDSGRKFDHAAASDADALILDLEDSVAPDQKPAARAQVRAMLERGAPGKQLWVRINALDGGDALADLAAAMPAAPYGIVLPKCAGREDMRQLAHYLDAFEAAAGAVPGATRILAIVTETAQSLFGLHDYRDATPRLWGLSWGGEDLAADVGALRNRDAGRYTEPFRLARSLCLMAAAAAGVRAIDTVCVDLDAPEALADEAREAYRDGFVGKMAIHPRHIGAINAALSPDEGQLQWARAVIAAFAAHPGAGTLRLDGKMIDRPHLRLARRLLGED